MKRTFTMNNKSYTSMMDIARELGVKRVYPKDFDKYGITEITDGEDVNNQEDKQEEVVVPVVAEEEVAEKDIVDAKVSDTEEAPAPKKEVKKPKQDKADESETATKVKKEVKKPEEKKEVVVTEESIDEVIAKTPELSIIEFNDVIGHWSVEKLVELAEKAGVDTWDKIENPPIRKMRLLMEIKKFYYPNEKTPVKPASIWKKVPLDKLVELADNKDVEYKKVNDSHIQRMWVIKALTDKGVTPEDLKPETNDSEEAGQEA